MTYLYFPVIIVLTKKVNIMEIINIEARTFEAMMERFQAFARKINLLCDQSEDKEMKEWLDSQEVCIILDISKRKLQYLRNFQKIPYSMINGKIYYKPEDVRKYIELERGEYGE
jgi:hypothetical protein